MSPHDDMVIPSFDYEQQESTEFTTVEKRRSKSTMVSFNRNVLVYDHIHLNNFSDEELDRTWYNDKELGALKKEILQTVKLMIEGNCPDDDETYCPRGLEYRTPAGAHLRCKHKYEGWDAVGFEQDRQWDEGLCDDEAIARAYHASAESCSSSAILLAQADAYFVEHEIMEELNHCQNTNCPCCRAINKSASSSSGHTRCRTMQVSTKMNQKRRVLRRQESPIAYAA